MDFMKKEISTDAESFSLSTQIYVRLRRVTGRVVDALYLVENRDYAQHVIELALATQDAELERYVRRLRTLLGLEPEPVATQESKSTQQADAIPDSAFRYYPGF